VNWDIVSAIGELAGAVAVVLSLVYLGRQVSLSNRLAQAEAWRTPISDLNSLNASFAGYPDFLDALPRLIGGAEPKDLGAREVQVVDIYLISVCNICEQLFREVRDGVLDEGALAEFTGFGVFAFPFVRARWPSLGPRLGRPFAQYVEAKYGLSGPSSMKDEGPRPAAS